jgi:hypothetical protein
MRGHQGKDMSMHTRCKLILAAITATALFGIAATVASANHLEVLWWERGFRITWGAATPLVFGGSGFEAEWRCQATLEGTFHSHSYAKVEGTLLGYITRASVASCTGGTGRILTETLPWHVRYESFATALPLFTKITTRIIGFALLLEEETLFGRMRCLFASEANNPMRNIMEFVEAGANLRKATNVRVSASLPVTTLPESQVICPSPVSLSSGASNAPTHQNETQPIEIKLIQLEHRQ